ncbi:unnamed protein product [Symbiodinium natans]|uniref:Uncharacterized protein n=1 Tax=Symbiodinium natans TaxID=878477 RepID=A0A812QQV8_9DINO|nr:unnamed protein product [Symbiodinium natans]
METPSLVRCLLAPPLMRILEAATETGADAAQVGLLCRAVCRRLWIYSEEWMEDKEAPAKKLLLAPSLRLGPKTSPACLQRFSPASLRRLRVVDAPAAFLSGSAWLPLLCPAAPTLEQLSIVLLRADVQARWPDILTAVADALEAKASERLMRFEARGLHLPSAASPALARVARSSARTLREFVADFADAPEDSASAALEDSELWDALSKASNLEVLRLGGLCLSAESCAGLSRTVRCCGGRLKNLGLSGLAASALLRPSSATEQGVSLRSELSPEMATLVAEGKQQSLRLTSLSLSGLQPPQGLHSFVAVAPNLRALLGAIEELAPCLTELDLSNNAAVTQEGFMPELLAILDNCGPLKKLDLSGSELCLSSAAAALHRSSLTLTSLALSGCAEPMPGPTGGSPLGLALQSLDALEELDLGDLGARPWLRKPILTALQQVAPTLRRLRGQLPAAILKAGLSSLFATGTFLEGGARRLEDVELSVGGPCDSLVPIFAAGPLRRLKLCGELGDGAGAKLAVALRGKPLEELSLQSCGLGSNTARYLGAMQSSQPWPLAVLDLSGNRLGAEGTALVTAFASSGVLRALRLRACGLEEDAMAPLGTMVVRATQLELVDVRGNPRLRAADATRQFLRASEEALSHQDSADLHGLAWGPPEAALPGRLDLRGNPGPGAPAGEDASQPLPRRIGRFEILLGDPGAANG